MVNRFFNNIRKTLKLPSFKSIFTRRFFASVLGYIFASVLFFQSYSLFSSYVNFLSGVNQYNSGNYSDAQDIFLNGKDKFLVEKWKADYNAGVAYYRNNMQNEARAAYSKARDELSKGDNFDEICKIDINISYSYEKSVANDLDVLNRHHFTDSESDRALESEQIRAIMKYIVQAVLSREKVNASCDFGGAIASKNNLAVIDSDKKLYQKLNERAYKLDGKNEDEIMEKDPNFVQAQNIELPESPSFASTGQTKTDKLMRQQIESQIEYQQNIEMSDSKLATTKTPW